MSASADLLHLIEEAGERARNATAGPWRVWHPGEYVVDAPGKEMFVCVQQAGDTAARDEDFDFIANARKDLPAALAALAVLLGHLQGNDVDRALSDAAITRATTAAIDAWEKA